MVQLRKNCAHPDLLESAYDGSCMFTVFSDDHKKYFDNHPPQVKLTFYLNRFLPTCRADSWTVWKISVAGQIAEKAISSQTQSMLLLLFFL